MEVYLPNYHPAERSEQRLQRLLEMLPGALMWSTFIGLALFAYLAPWGMAIFIIVFDVYWLIRVLYFAGLMLAAYVRLQRESGIDWYERATGVSDLPAYVDDIEGRLARLQREIEGGQQATTQERKLKLRQRGQLERHLHEIQRLQLQRVTVKPWDSVYHLVVIATYREAYEVLEASFNALVNAHYPGDRLIVVLATEEREGAPAQEKAARLREKFARHFRAFLVTVHPANLPGEARVKAANTTWAAKQARAWLDAQRIAYEDVIISVFDADTCADAEYFACLTYHYITRPDRLRCSYQPLPMYHNNIWDAPVFSRMAANITSYWQMVQSIRPDLLITFSSHAMSFQALVDVDYWPVDVISDDSVIFYRCLLRYGGDYQTVPMFVSVHMDANLGKNYWRTTVSLYKQMRRWAWGVENFPLLVRGFRRDRLIRLRTKLRYTLQLMESHYTWSTAAIILTVYAWLPLWFGGEKFGREVIAHNLPQVVNWMFRIGGIGMLVSAFLCIVLLPPKPPQYPWRRWVWMALQWLLIPVYYAVLVALPAVDAQTRLMLGKYLTFSVTEKRRAPSSARVLPETRKASSDA